MYTIKKISNNYFIEEDGEVMLTPGGKPVVTESKALAQRLVTDLEEYGEQYTDPTSLICFHYSMLDFFSVMPRSELEKSVAIGLDKDQDWTFNCPSAEPQFWMNWISLFGMHSSVYEERKEWLSTLNLMQLCAVCIIGRAIESVNIPFIVATMVPIKDLKAFSKEIDKHYPYIGVNDLVLFFKNFLFYFNLDQLNGQ